MYLCMVTQNNRNAWNVLILRICNIFKYSKEYKLLIENYSQEKKEEIWLSPMTKAPTPTEKSKKQRDNTKPHQKRRLHNDCGPT